MRQEDSSAIILQKFAQVLEGKLRDKRILGLLQKVQAWKWAREREMQEV